MLKRFRVNNFKSLLNFEFRPSGVNLLIGRNNAGKTNLCSALRFISLSSLTTLESAALSAVGETWNLTNANVIENPEMEFEIDCSLSYEEQLLDFSYKLRLQAQQQGIGQRQALKVVKEILSVTGGEFQQTSILDNDGHQAQMLHEEGFVQKRSDPPYRAKTLSPEDATMLSRLYELEDNPRATLFKQYLHSWLYFSLSPDALRSPDVLRDYPFLRHDGANLSRAMHVLHNEKPRLERKIIEMLRPIEPYIVEFIYNTPDPEHVYMFLKNTEDYKDIGFSTRSMSDGTLRFLAMTYLLVVCNERSKEAKMPHVTRLGYVIPPRVSKSRESNIPLIMIEEPENGIYVGHLKPLLQQIDMSGAAGQFIFTSHSPYFIDLFDSNLEGIHVIKPGKPSSVLVKPDPSKVKALLDQMPLGEMHYREMLA